MSLEYIDDEIEKFISFIEKCEKYESDMAEKEGLLNEINGRLPISGRIRSNFNRETHIQKTHKKEKRRRKLKMKDAKLLRDMN